MVHNNIEVDNMKKMMVGSIVAMGVGASMMAYALTNKKTRCKANKLVNNALDMANDKINKMK
jgi:2-keto-3-deoxy-6-phosphogluconate aldolase